MGGDPSDLGTELESARRALGARDFAAGLAHLAAAASLDPAHREVFRLLDLAAAEIGPGAPDEIQPATPGQAAVRAWLLRGAGRTGEAVPLLLYAVGSDPERPWASWLVRWLKDDPKLAIPAADLVRTCTAATSGLDDLATVVEAALPQHPGNGALYTAGSVVARHADRLDDATAWAEEGERLEPSALSAAALGHARLRGGDDRGAFAAFELASRRDPTDPAPRLAAADVLIGAGQWDLAASWAESAWRLDPERGEAAARTLYARYHATGDEADIGLLLDWIEARLDEDGFGPASLGDALDFTDRLAAELPWLLAIPVPRHAVIDIARQVRADRRRARATDSDKTLDVRLSGYEAPSAALALALTCGGRLSIRAADPGLDDPDPRLPRGPVDTLAWKPAADGSELVPAVPPPPPAAVAAVQIRPARWYGLAAAQEDGARLAAAAPAGVTAGQLVSLAVHPPPPPRPVPAWDWVRRWQVVCCIALAERDEFDVLRDLADGPEDWLSDAALAGLVHLASRRRDLRARIVEFANDHLVESVDRLERIDLPTFGSECDLFELLPGVPADDVQAARDFKERWAETAEPPE